MSKRVYAPEHAAASEINNSFGIDAVDKSGTMILEPPEALSQASQSIPSFAAYKLPARKLTRKGLKIPPFVTKEPRKKRKIKKKKALNEIRMYQKTGDLLIKTSIQASLR